MQQQMQQESGFNKNLFSDEMVSNLLDQRPNILKEYLKTHEEKLERYIVKNFWEEDVGVWLEKIRQRSPEEHLQVRKMDFLKKANMEAHQTSLYENASLVIRRASVFNIDVHFGNRSFDPKRDDLSICFSIGQTPTAATNTLIACPVADKAGEKTKWYCTLLATDSAAKKVSLQVHIPANAIIGRYRVSLDITSGTQKGLKKTTHKNASFIVLFNPFSEDDSVFMENEEFRKEYVLNDKGFVNTGAYNGSPVGKKNWDFAQFDDGILDSVLLMLQKDARYLSMPIKSLKKYNSPVFVSRVLTAMINCNDDDGVLFGQWDGDYKDGKSPASWNSSAAILDQWKNNNMKPVKYGQCWVFSALLTTALRAIGIPGRSVTNFNSAHDTDLSQTIDIYIRAVTYEELDTDDSVWNFHVWNEGFFRRPDLPQGYDGWQVLDATPQEESAIRDPANKAAKTLMQCGPAPVKAVREGDINIGYDTAFVFSEVNADKLYWLVDDDDKIGPAPIHIDTRAIGVYIGTKAVGNDLTDNIVSQYKYPEGSAEERKAFNKAYGLGSKDHSGKYGGEREYIVPDFETTISKIEDATIGQDLIYTITVRNVSKIKQQASLTIKARSKKHVGSIHALLKKASHTLQIDAGKEKVLDFKLVRDDYISKIVDDFTINVIAVVTGTPDGKTTMNQKDISLELPQCISATVPSSIYGGEQSAFSFELKNTLPMKLTNGIFRIKGRGVTSSNFIVEEPILPGASYKVEDLPVKTKLGWRRAYAYITFECAEVDDMNHFALIKVDM